MYRRQQSDARLPSFSCPRYCKHKECRRHAPSPVLEPVRDCVCLGPVNESSLMLRIVRDLANTLTDVMIICGIPRCKAKLATDVITAALLQCEHIYFCIDAHAKKRLRKRELLHDLAARCGMTSAQVQLGGVIVARGFRAFYYVPSGERFNRYRHSQTVPRSMPHFMEECVYCHAARKTVEFYTRFGGLSHVEHRRYETKIKEAYSKFVHKMQNYFIKAPCEECNCCMCVKNRSQCDEVPPQRPKQRGRVVYKCGWTRRHISGAVTDTTMRQVRAKSAKAAAAAAAAAAAKARAAKHQFTLDWVKSIWTRADFDEYYKDEIAAYAGQVEKPADYCRPLTEAEVDARMAAAELAMNPPQIDSLQKFCSKIN